MSAAEPADPTRHPTLNADGRGDVIDITKHRRRGSAHPATQGRWTMATPPGPDHGPPEQSALARFANDVEISLNEIGESLTSDRTAAIFVRTVQIFGRILEGSKATGLIDQAQLDELLEVARGLEQAPRLLA